MKKQNTKKTKREFIISEQCDNDYTGFIIRSYCENKSWVLRENLKVTANEKVKKMLIKKIKQEKEYYQEFSKYEPELTRKEKISILKNEVKKLKNEYFIEILKNELDYIKSLPIN